MRARRRRGTRGQSGQALVETTMVLLILLFSLTGMFAVGSEANDKNIATSAVRAGGRFVAQLGAYQWAVGQPTNPNVVDGPAVREVCDIARTMSNMTVTSITIYRPSVVGGAQQPGDPADEYDFPANVNPSTCQVSPADVAATIYHCLGIDPHAHLTDQLGRPMVASTGKPINALLG